ncbi:MULTISPECIES: hypothetical protein [unclassified Streptomyces]|uniref:hypothetical protein n=1 Tax=unclassified Streptomyces TaxID=2593676 RepID=UPI00336A29A9
MDGTQWATAIGLGFGTALGFAGAFGGFTAFLIVLVLGAVGLLAGRAVAGEHDLSGRLGGRRRS